LCCAEFARYLHPIPVCRDAFVWRAELLARGVGNNSFCTVILVTGKFGRRRVPPSNVVQARIQEP